MAGAERKEILNVPLVALFKVITDFDSYPQFVSGVKNTKVLSSVGGNKQVEFDIDMMKRVKYTLNVQENINEAAGTGTVHWTLVSSDMLKSNVGGWTLKALDAGRTEVIYKLDLDFNISVPGFILKGMVSKALPEAIREFAERAKKVSA